MPLNVRRFYSSVLLVFVSFVFISQAQNVATSSAVPASAPTSGDVMRERISKAKAFIVVGNYNAAIYELENIRKETADTSVQAVVNVLLMNSYLEQGDYRRAQDLLNEFYNQQKTSKPNASANYMSVAAQVVKGARSRAERYRALGLSVSDRTLPLEALNDLEKMRETLEIVITQSKEIGADKAKMSDGMALLEEASNSRGMLARDDYDSRRWKDELLDTREKMAVSQSVVMSAVNGKPAVMPKAEMIANNTQSSVSPVVQPITDDKSVRERDVTAPANTPSGVASNDKPIYIPSSPPTVKEEPKKEETQPVVTVPSAPSSNNETPSTIEVGSLLSYATKQAPPIYPNAAKTARQTGMVKVEVTIDENGRVAQIQKAIGPMMLQGAAKDAIRKWEFKPFLRDGQPVRATGFVSFNFSL
jgi:protein TonB